MSQLTTNEKSKNPGNSALQVEKSHYNFQTYTDLPRWTSYWHQITETLALSPKTALIVGIGDDIVGRVLAEQGVQVYTFDFDKNLHPDFWGDVVEIDTVLRDKRFDVILCCQVLEHLPYDKFEPVLQQLQRHAKNVIISLPYSAIKYKIDVHLPIVKTVKLTIHIHKFFKRHKFDGQHYWEIGTRGYTKRRIRNSMEKFFTVAKWYVAPYNAYHVFFILENR
ncbi:MAG: class I SAM-dependent methyltransferase [Dysgonamonadaceae bacterium]|jgi:2-polyprenyl-3-methyl-5-hydroxy-6-metoxy-1,4-benzoquinol methylase|nr:class I SAM-dependent methyltransferase [Dysgonamonadaceae bacterium]